MICDEPTGHCTQCDTNLTGSKCDIPCGEHCRHGKCIHGACADGCEAGYFGELCSNVCNSTCISNICDTASGICTKGCEVGWEGVFCEVNVASTSKSTSADESKYSTGELILIVLGSIAGFIIIVVLGCLLHCHRSRRAHDMVM